MRPVRGVGLPRRSPRPIVRPGAPSWAGAVAGTGSDPDALPWLLLFVAVMVAGGLLGVAFFLHHLVALGAVALFGPMAVPIEEGLRLRGDVVGPPGYRYEGVSLNDAVLDLLEDVQGRFDYAKRNVAEVPTGIDWRDIGPHVQVLLWEAAGHGARVTGLDKELSDLRYAEPGTPQAVMRDRLAERRAEHWQSILDVQREAESLARVAGNAAAAAKVALARTGSLKALEVVAPSGREIAARSALDDARARLSMLADAWTELDDSGDLLAEKLRLDQRPERGLKKGERD
jgi:hypothetical protein